MKKILLFTVASCVGVFTFGQGQITNGDMEQWEAVAGNEEPVNWNSFLTGSGTWSSFANNQIEQSSDVRPGSSGTKSCRIWANSVLGIIANGNVTLGRIEMGSTTPTAPENYNYTITGNPDFSQPLTDQPDSIVFWAKFKPVTGSDIARMKATLHTNYDYRDPEDAGSAAEVVATAVLNYPSTNNSWMRFAVPFVYSGPAATANQAYILATFTTNEIGGGGSASDEIFIDDVQLIYNPVGLEENANDGIVVSMNNTTNAISVISSTKLDGDYTVYNVMGQAVQSGEVENEIPFTEVSGVYFVHVAANNKTYKFEILKN